VNLGNSIEYSQQKRENLGDLINETLEKMEMTGGEDAYSACCRALPTCDLVRIAGDSWRPFMRSQFEIHGPNLRICVPMMDP
jgi:hypothetical protein